MDLQSLIGLPLVAAVDKLLAADAVAELDRLNAVVCDQRRLGFLRRWRRVHDYLQRRSPRGSVGVAQSAGIAGLETLRRIWAPPAQSVLRLLTGPAWWQSFDVYSLSPAAVDRGVDPLLYYSRTLQPPEMREAVIANVADLRAARFPHTVGPLVESIINGGFGLEVVGDNGPQTVPPRSLEARHWRLDRAEGGLLLMPVSDGRWITYRRPTLVGPALSITDVPAGKRKGGRLPKYEWEQVRGKLRKRLEYEGYPRLGDGRQAELERWIVQELADDDGNGPGESQVRRFVKGEIEAYKRDLH